MFSLSKYRSTKVETTEASSGRAAFPISNVETVRKYTSKLNPLTCSRSQISLHMLIDESNKI